MPLTSKATSILSWVIDGLNPGTLYPHSLEFQTHLTNFASRHNYDLIWDAGCNMLRNLAELRSSVPLLADQVDNSFLRLFRELRLATTPYAKLWTIKQIVLQWMFLFQHLRHADAVLFVSQVDADSFRRLIPAASTRTIENGVDELYFNPDLDEVLSEQQEEPEIVFEGAMCFSPNIDAVRYFVDEILPLIRNELPGVRFTIVGRDPTKEVMALAGNGVEITGSVPDIRPYLDRAEVFVCPMRSGTGIKNKILQAWAMRKAIVSTPEGVGGLKIIEGGNILVRNTPQSFAMAVVELLLDKNKAGRLGKSGRDTVLAHYTWKAKAEELENLMTSIVQEHKSKMRDQRYGGIRCG
jgi:glycosyltransferase involved in cell wall biosynthesis